jgi:hypothetical protein
MAPNTPIAKLSSSVIRRRVGVAGRLTALTNQLVTNPTAKPIITSM